MYTFKLFFIVYSKKILKNISFIFVLILLPVIIFSVINIGDDNGIKVGIYLENNGVYENKIAEKLKVNEEINFILYEDVDLMTEDVAKSKIVLAYVFNENFSQNMTDLKVRNSIKLIAPEGDVYKDYINTIVFSNLFDNLAALVTADILEDFDVYLEVDEITEKTEKYNFSEHVFNLNIEIFDSEKVDSDNDYMLGVYKGIICLFLVTFMLISTVDIIDIKAKNSIFSPYLGIVKLKFYTIFPLYVFSTISAISGIALIKIYINEIFVIKEILAVLLLQIVFMCLSILLSSFMNKNILMVLTPLIVIFVFISHPIIFNMVSFFPDAEFILRFLPSYWYLIL